MSDKLAHLKELHNLQLKNLFDSVEKEWKSGPFSENYNWIIDEFRRRHAILWDNIDPDLKDYFDSNVPDCLR